MAYDPAEQEQLESIKAWWKQYGNLITWVLIISLAAYGGWTGWQVWQRNKAQQAAQLYEQVQKAVAGGDKVAVQRAATDLREKFGNTTYAQMSALAAAKAAFEAKDVAAAKGHLQWVINQGSEAEFRAIARIRLASILLDENAHEEALKLLAGDFPPQFADVVADRKGDILVAQNKLEEARAAYQLALEKMSADNPVRQVIELKLNAIGGTPAKAAA